MNKEMLYYMTLGACCAIQFLLAVALLFIAVMPTETAFAGIDTQTRVWITVLAVTFLFTAWSCWKV